MNKEEVISILRTGDRVEMDMKTGEVRKIKRSEDDKEPKLRPEFIRRMKRISKQKGITFRSVEELRKHIEKN